MNAELIGFLAATLSTVSYLPQVIHTFRSRDTTGISLGMYILLVAGTSLWLAYGIALNSIPLIIANIITVSLSTTILSFKLFHLYTGKDTLIGSENISNRDS